MGTPASKMTNIQNTHPRKYGKGSRKCRVCNSHHGLIRKYHMMICRQCFREKAQQSASKSTTKEVFTLREFQFKQQLNQWALRYRDGLMWLEMGMALAIL